MSVTLTMNRTISPVVAILFFALFACVPLARAQTNISAYAAGGTATDSSVGPIDTLGAGTTYPGPSMGGFFKTYGADVVFYHNFGVGAEYSTRVGKGSYAGLLYDPIFMDGNVVYRPHWRGGRVNPEFQAGYGRADLKLFYTPQICYKLPQGCSAVNGEVISVSDSEFHFSAGLRFKLYRGVFLRPQFDMRHVPNDFSTYFGSSWIPQYSVAIGYSFDWGKWLGGSK